MKESKNPITVHKPLAGYVHQIALSDMKKQLILSGQIGMDIDGNIPDTVDEQFEIAIDNIIKNLSAANMTTSNIDKLTIYLSEDMDGKLRKDILEKKLGAHKPCMTLIYVKALANPKLKVEIDTLASSE
jgi:enamine deaminase RidA (YjgF/YER057c/UK114 family)